MTSVTHRLADMMLEMGSFAFRPDRPVRWASGYLMPVYNDNRRLLSHPAARGLAADGFAEILERRGLSVRGVVGTATGGIAPATSLADRLGVRLYYVRSGSKDHGLGRQVEGLDDIPDPDPVVLVEDLVSTGGSSARAAAAVHEAGLTLVHGLSVFSYGFAKAAEQFSVLPFPFTVEPLVTIDDLLERAQAGGRISGEQLDSVREWAADPFAWGTRWEMRRGPAGDRETGIDGKEGTR